MLELSYNRNIGGTELYVLNWHSWCRLEVFLRRFAGGAHHSRVPRKGIVRDKRKVAGVDVTPSAGGPRECFGNTPDLISPEVAGVSRQGLATECRLSAHSSSAKKSTAHHEVMEPALRK